MELYYRATDAFARRDLDAFLALVDPGVEFVARTGFVEGGGSYRGHDGVRRWFEELLSVFPDWRSEIREVRDPGDLVIVKLRAHAHGVGSAVPVDLDLWQVVEARHAKAIWWATYTSEAEALEAARLRQEHLKPAE